MHDTTRRVTQSTQRTARTVLMRVVCWLRCSFMDRNRSADQWEFEWSRFSPQLTSNMRHFASWYHSDRYQFELFILELLQAWFASWTATNELFWTHNIVLLRLHRAVFRWSRLSVDSLHRRLWMHSFVWRKFWIPPKFLISTCFMFDIRHSSSLLSDCSRPRVGFHTNRSDDAESIRRFRRNRRYTQMTELCSV